MLLPMKMEKKYYVFISYKSEDVEWAIWLQHELEHYHLPAIYNGRTDVRQKLYPVFRDLDELSAGNLPEQIQRALMNSENLVVICSPKSAKSEWVNKEVETFISMGRLNHVFPFIVDGDGPSDFFPEALKKLPETEERLGGDVRISGRDAAFVKVVAGMLGLEFDSLWNRYEKEKAEKERLDREQRDNLLKLQSRFLAEKSLDLIEKGDSYLARKIALLALPKGEENDRPYVVEAENALRMASRKDETVFEGHTHSVIASIFNHDGRKIYSCDMDGKIFLWDAGTGGLIVSKVIHKGIIKAIDISPDDSLLVSASSDKTAVIMDAFSLEQKGLPLVHKTKVNDVAFSQCGRYIFTALSNGYVWVWDLDGNLKCKFDVDSGAQIQTVLILDSSNILISSAGRNIKGEPYTNIKLFNWDCNTFQAKELRSFDTECVDTFQRFTLCERELIYVAKPKILFFSQNENLILYTLKDDKVKHIHLFPSSITAFAVNPSGTQLAVACSEKLYVYNLVTKGKFMGEPAVSIELEHNVSAVEFSPSKRDALIVSFAHGLVRLFDFRINPRVKDITSEVDSMCMLPDGNYATASGDCHSPCSIYDSSFSFNSEIIPEKLLMDDFHEYGLSYRDCDRVFYNHKDKKLYCLGDLTVYEYDFDTQKIISHPLVGQHNYECSCKTISSDGRRAVYRSKGQWLCLIDVASGRIIRVLENGPLRNINHSACFSPNSELVAAILRDGSVRVFEAEFGEFVQDLPIHSTFSGSYIEFSQDGEWLISASTDYYIYLWSYDKTERRFELKKMLKGHDEPVRGATLSNSAELVASISTNKIIIWDMESEMPLEIIPIEPVTNVKFIQFNLDDSKIFFSDNGELFEIEFHSLDELVKQTAKSFNSRELTHRERRMFYLE